jgi:antitoxin ParD1/3/4
MEIHGINCHTSISIHQENCHVHDATFPSELEERIRQRVESGKYGSTSEVLREALNLFEAYENVKTAKLDSLRQDIAKGLSDAQNGRTKEIDFASLKQQGRQLLKDRKAA